MTMTKDAVADFWDAIFFDFDGVLCDSLHAKADAYAALYEGQGEDVQQAIRDFHLANGGMSRAEKIARFEERQFGRAPSPERLNALVEQFAAAVESAVVASAWIAGAKDFVERHQGRLPMFIISATPEEELLRIAEARSMTAGFTAIHGWPKTKGQTICHLLDEGGWAPSRCVMIGDAIVDYRAAEEAGTPFIGVLAPGETSPFPAGTTVIPDLKDLEEMLLALGRERAVG
ncbi:HAD family hydrolase [Telmatospirillum sp. J64-1]|uniref:HAD family hydrolase n=1 Tax=Telmatospirillum sp. J64-1 TaxID=2502183 RepID=UPI00115D39B6|nr:HAD-IA family hydrolase [Telmatospirillum sp. J64-1]